MEKENGEAGTRRRTGTRRTAGKGSNVRKSNYKSKSVATRRKVNGGTKRRTVKKPSVQIPGRFIAGAVVLVVLIVVIVMAARGCGVSHKSPEGVVKSLVTAYVKGNEKKVKKCYGVSTADDNLQKEMDATVKYFEAHNVKSMSIIKCDVMYTDGNNTYVYITYNLELENGQTYPCISTYMVQKKDENKYYVLTAAEITDEMSKQAATEYAKFMSTDPYKEYLTAYDKFIKKNPGYEDKIATKLS